MFSTVTQLPLLLLEGLLTLTLNAGRHPALCPCVEACAILPLSPVF